MNVLVKLKSLITKLLKGDQPTDLEALFTDVFHKNHWGSRESASGGGSTLQQTEVLRAELIKFIAAQKITSFLDVPCGDANWVAAEAFFGLRYTGLDIVRSLIQRNRSAHSNSLVSFQQHDITKTPFVEQHELVFCRDLLVHLDLERGRAVIKNLVNSSSKWVALTSFSEISQNRELNQFTGSVDEIYGDGWRPINLDLAPFFLPAAKFKINERCTEFDSFRIYSDKEIWIFDKHDLELAGY